MQLNLFVEEFIGSYGLLSIFLIVMLEYASIPLPSEIILPLIGVLAIKYNLDISIVIITSIIAGVIGSLITYYLGYSFGGNILHFLIKKYPKTKKSIHTSYKWIGKYGRVSVMLSRFIPLARTFISIIAGVSKMEVTSFAVYSGIGLSIWNIALIMIGYVLGDNIHLMTEVIREYSVLMMVLGIVGITIFIFVKRTNIALKKNNKL